MLATSSAKERQNNGKLNDRSVKQWPNNAMSEQSELHLPPIYRRHRLRYTVPHPTSLQLMRIRDGIPMLEGYITWPKETSRPSPNSEYLVKTTTFENFGFIQRYLSDNNVPVYSRSLPGQRSQKSSFLAISEHYSGSSQKKMKQSNPRIREEKHRSYELCITIARTPGLIGARYPSHRLCRHNVNLSTETFLHDYQWDEEDNFLDVTKTRRRQPPNTAIRSAEPRIWSEADRPPTTRATVHTSRHSLLLSCHNILNTHLRLVSWKCNGLPRQRHELLQLICEYDIDIPLLQKNQPPDSSTNFHHSQQRGVSHRSSAQQDWNNRAAGGTAIFVNRRLPLAQAGLQRLLPSLPALVDQRSKSLLPTSYHTIATSPLSLTNCYASGTYLLPQGSQL
ncbi:hypothetical protein J6590_066575 [Homalodisca vitripennis]|nr:hypothetical protein J6590_066575 [Homalodisca vitripennis]